MNFNEEVKIRDFITTVSLDAKIKFNYLINLGNTTSGWTTGDDVHTRARGGVVLCSVNVCVCAIKLCRKRLLPAECGLSAE